MNTLIVKLNQELAKHNLCCQVKKETTTLLRCYLYDLSDFKELGAIKDYRDCKKFDTTYKKQELYIIINNNSLKSFCETEKSNFEIAKKLNMLRR